MRSRLNLSVVDLHSAAAPARVVVGGVTGLPDVGSRELRRHLMETRDDLRKLLMYEPRGRSDMSGSIVVPPKHPDADVGLVFIEVSGWPPMCGAGTIGAATALIETGMVPVTEPTTQLTIETPAGLVRTAVDVEDGVVQQVRLHNVPSYLADRDVHLEVPGWGDVEVDISYGGNFYVIVPATRFGLEIVPENGAQLATAAAAVRDAAREQWQGGSRSNTDVESVELTILTEPQDPVSKVARNMVFFGSSGVDRSPGGTGTSARMAQRFARGELALGEPFIHESIVGSRFTGRLLEEVTVDGQAAVLPEIAGRAHIVALTTFVLDPDDPFTEGFGVGYGDDAAAPVHA